MKIQLDYKIDIEVKEADKTKDKLTIFIREFTKIEKKEQDVLRRKFEAIFKKLNKISKKQDALTKKAELYELNGDYEKAIKSISACDDLEDEIEELNNEIESIGGTDQEAFVEKMAEDRFNKLVSGKDKEKLRELADRKGYQVIMHLLDTEKAELEKKEFGE